MTNITPTADPGIIEPGVEYWVEWMSIESLWILYSITGFWGRNQGWRTVAIFNGLVHVAMENVIRRKEIYNTSFFVVFLLGRVKIDTSRHGLTRGALLLLWLALDAASLWIGPVFWATKALEGFTVCLILLWLYTQVTQLRGTNAPYWVVKLLRLVVWGLAWGVLSALFLTGFTTDLPMVCLFLLYGYLFPIPELKDGPDVPGRNPSFRISHIYEEVPLPRV
uniref:Derlin n=1 Tax=Knipowitschia caucasica TaxID=637954 RepID=A0AAV2L9X9_KNICA